MSVFSNRYWDFSALCMNLTGTLLISYSFQASPSDFRLTEMHFPPAGMRVGKAEQAPPLYSICVNNSSLASAQNGGTVFGDSSGCVNGDENHVAIVTANHPSAAWWGFVLNLAGFALQALSMLFKRIT